jgi:hypothetical protein
MQSGAFVSHSRFSFFGIILIAHGVLTFGQDHNHGNQSSPQMPAMNMEHESKSLVDLVEHHAASGTDAAPGSTPEHMLMGTKNGWTLMFHGQAFLNDLQQSGPRGFDKLFSTNWFMPMAQHKLGRGTFTVKTMLSLDPATVSKQRYPELFQEGETAFRRPIVDGQHPHDFVMELAALYDYRLGDKTLLSFYGAPVGDPAMGPVAYPHRMSAAENPVAPLGHHLQDSTHIANDVTTVSLAHQNVRLEVSGFHGREPDEHRWNIDSGTLDSWSARLTFNPGQNWSFQYSIAKLHSPEALQPTEDVRRMTASLMYNRPLSRGNWSSMLLWGRNQSLSDGNVGNAYLLESALGFASRNNVWTRIENVDRTNALLLGETVEPPNFRERYFTRVQAYTLGYDREIGQFPHLSIAIGGQITWYKLPENLKQTYDSNPRGGIVFLRLRFQ